MQRECVPTVLNARTESSRIVVYGAAVANALLLVMCAMAVVAEAAEVDPRHPLAPALEHAYKARDAAIQVTDYEAEFEKREWVNRKLTLTRTKLKVREKPFSVYMQFVEPYEGREVIYVDGKNKGMLLAHETGIRSIAGTVSLEPQSEDAMDGNRYPITMVGIRNLVEKIIAQWEEEAKYGETEVKYYPNAELFKMPCKVIESSHPTPRKQFKFKQTRLFIDKQSGLPVRVEQRAFPSRPEDNPPLVEEYTYKNLRPNLGLADADFDTRNPNYAFPR